jgi:hypothetical protein
VAFKDIEQFIEPLTLTIRGKEYPIAALGSLDGIKLAEHLADPTETPMSDVDFQKLMLGDAYDQMVADNVPGVYIVRAAMTALADTQGSRGAAEVMWETGGDPKAVNAWQAAQAATTPPAEATTTKRPATGTGTKTSPKSSPQPAGTTSSGRPRKS